MAENTNNSEDVRAKFSEAEKIFVPKDLDKDGNISDYTEYKVKFFNWRMVPENHVLVTKNIFTGVVKSKEGIGLKFMLPFVTKSILVSTVDRTIDYEKIDYLTKDGIMANVDIAVVIKITDSALYMKGGKEQLEQLNVLVKQLLRVYVAGRNYDELSRGECKLTDFDGRHKFHAFSNLYGIDVSKVIFKEVRLPERMQKLYNDRVEEEQKQKAQKIRLKAAKEKAQAEAEILGIQSDAEAKRMAKLVKALIDEGVPMEDAIKHLNIKTASANGNAIFMNGSNMASDVAMGVAAGNVSTQNRNSDNHQYNLTNSQKLINSIEQYLNMGMILNQGAMNLYQNLQHNQNLRDSIDHFSEKDYKRIEEATFKDMNLSSDFDEDMDSSRGRRR